MLERVPDWTSRLDRFLLDHRDLPFAWGANDCVLFALDAVLAITRSDLGLPFRGRYRTARGAAGAMKRYAGDLRACALSLAREHGLPTVPAAFAQRGDVGLSASTTGPAIVVRVTDCWVGPGPQGLERLMPTPSIAWAIGRSV